ncbi:MAG TPA: ATP-binding cassette domain-containing protein [Bacteroidales bacterium]|nr:ATP-binding cassette domain-containing protein [Bacteroidales bacterium]
MKHLGIYLSNSVNKKQLIDEIFSNSLLKEHLDISTLKGALHSPITIDKIIDEEVRHDKFPIKTRENASLMSMSSGQQRKALLAYLIDQKPDFIILDDIFSSIDSDTQQYILRYLEQHSKNIQYIQLFYRKHDVLSFIDTVISVNEQFQVISQESLELFKNKHESSEHLNNVTLPYLFNEAHLDIDPLIQLNSVSAAYGDKPVLNNINWTIRPGEFWQLKGPIGSGKSTLLSMIIGDNPRGYGQDMMLFGCKKGSGESVWDIKKQIGYFYPTLTQLFTHDDTVENMIISGILDSIGLYKKPTDLHKRIANAWLQVLGSSFQNKRFQELSSGQQRIVLVVRAMVKQPPLLILDEPTAGLDDHNAQLFINLVSAIASQRKVAIIYVSHRSEPGLLPDKVLELVPTHHGSVAKVL